MLDESSYLELLELTYLVAQSLQGRQAPNQCLPDCNQLAAKLFFHGATIYWLSHGTKTPVPKPDGASFYDFASVAVLTRSILETYLTMFEIFFEPTSDDEREFRHALWLLSGFVIREKHMPPITTSFETVAQSRREIQELRERLQRTQVYAQLTGPQKRRVMAGRTVTRETKERLRAAGFGSGTFAGAYSYLSGYVHSDGLSAAQIIQAATKESQLEYVRGAMCLAMTAMAKMILQYKRLFPSALACCLAKPRAMRLAEVWGEGASIVE